MPKKKTAIKPLPEKAKSKSASKKAASKSTQVKTKSKPVPKKKASTKPVPPKSKSASKKAVSEPIRPRTKTKPLPKKAPSKRALPSRAGVLGIAIPFDATTNGFGFVNYWSFSDGETGKIQKVLADSVDRVLKVDPLIGQSLTLLGVRSGLTALVSKAVPQAYGLCGGMAFSALDYYTAGMPIPPGTAQPTYSDSAGKKLRDYLVRRQVDSLKDNLPTILLWIAILHLVPSSPFFKSGAPWLFEQTKEQWKILKSQLDNQQPTPLALIGTNPDPCENHQVLAYKYEEFSEMGVPKIRLHVYDMNCPGTAQTMELDFNGEELVVKESCASPTRGPLQGFLCEHYSFSQPPALSGFG